MRTVLVLLTGCAVFAFGQPSRVFHIGPSQLTEFAIIGAPFSCEISVSTSKTGSDGTQFSWDWAPGRLYRDSAGRTRMETPVFGGTSELKLVTIWEPADGYQYVLDPQHQVAHRLVVKSSGSKIAEEAYQLRSARMPAPASAARPSVVKEAIGNQTLADVATVGWRFTTTFPAGFVGNDRPFAAVEERWVAPTLALVLQKKRSDPRWGERSMRVTKLERAEPDPALFQVPPGYSVVDEAGPFQLVFVRPAAQPAAGRAALR